jgi:ribosomal-protein-alanine N-acetyltransferase
MLQSAVIRPYNPSDFGQILEIEKEAFNPVNPSYNVYLYSTFCNRFLVVDFHGKVAGYIATMDLSPWEEKIISFAVKKNFRQRGLGKLLLNHVLSEIRKTGKKYVILEVRVSNVIAQRLYKKMGFVVKDVIPNYYHDGEDALLMQLQLTERES